MGSSPAFSFYAKDFLTGTATMTLAERGAYVSLLAYQWDSGSVPAGAKERARIMGCTAAEERRVWAKLVTKFAYVDDSFKNTRLEEERAKQIERRQKLAANGSKGGSQKAANASRELPQLGGQKPSLSSSSSFSSATNSAKNAELGVSAKTRTPSLIARGESVQWAKKHQFHIDGFCDWVCLDRDQRDEFAAKIPGDDLTLKHGEIYAWAQSIRAKWADRIIPDGSHFDFWRNRWTETHGGSRPANATLRAARAANDIDEAFR